MLTRRYWPSPSLIEAIGLLYPMLNPTPMSGKETHRILCVGITPCLQRTVRFSSLQLGQVDRARSITVSSGGKSTNVARTLKVLKESPLVAGFAGGGTGDTMVSFLGGMGIETDIVWTDQPLSLIHI